jgi:Sortase and related acyltransferases
MRTMEQPTIRLATSDDARAIADIYAPSVRDTFVSFETEVPDAVEMSRRIEYTLPEFPWLVREIDGQVAGYAYASRHRERLAYRWSVDVSCYTHAQFRRRGVGASLYTALLRMLRRQGFCNAYAGIALPNEASVALHESVGFRPIGIYAHAGYKHGAWRDVGWWGCDIAPRAALPEDPVALARLRPGILDDL